jgi:hypothetical protein
MYSCFQLIGGKGIVDDNDWTPNARTAEENFNVLVTVTSHDANTIPMPQTHRKHSFSHHFAAIRKILIRESSRLPWY